MPGQSRAIRIGNIEVRDVENTPGRFDGLALPYGVAIDVPYGKERFVRGAFAEQVEAINRGERIAYLSRHGEDGGIPVGVISQLQERSEGLWFAGDFLDVPEVGHTRQQISSGLNGVSIEFVPGRSRRRADVVEHYAGARLAGVAGSYAPAYRDARVALRSVARATEGKGHMPALSTSALTERRDALTQKIATIRQVAESEDRTLDDSETTEIETLNTRVANVNALITDAEAEAQRRDVERKALPQQSAGSGGAIITRQATVYGPGTGQSYFADLVGVANRDAAATERMSRHRSLVADLAQQMERRAVDSVDIAGAYPTTSYPDLYVPDLAYNGPLSSFFVDTPIAAPNPISVPAFGTQTGDTGEQPAENAPLPNVDITTAPVALTPKTIGGEVTVSRQAVDGATPGIDTIISNQLRELLMRDRERMIALVLEALASSGDIGADGAPLHGGLVGALGSFYAGDAAGGVNARFLPAEGVFVNATSWGSLVGATAADGRPLMPYVAPMNVQGQTTGVGFQAGIIGGTPVLPAWALLGATNEVIARRNDARQWSSAVLDIRLMEREGPQSIVFAIWQYYGFAVLQPKGVRLYKAATPVLNGTRSERE